MIDAHLMPSTIWGAKEIQVNKIYFLFLINSQFSKRDRHRNKKKYIIWIVSDKRFPEG